MNPTMYAVNLGLKRGWIEFKINMKNPQTFVWTLIFVGAFLTVLWFQRDAKIEGMSLALLTLPSLLGMQIANDGFSGMASILSYDKEDGTMLRAKATPQGMFAYLISKITMTLLSAVLNLVLLLVPGLFLVQGLTSIGMSDVLVFAGVFVIGLLATTPFGAIIGAIVKSSGSGFGLTFLPMIALVAISGIFYPITALAGWVQAIAQVFPVYWVGLGMRSVFLPDAAAAIELGGSWRTFETFAVLAAWAIVGLLITPRILRRMTRRVSGSEMQAGRDRTVQRGY